MTESEAPEPATMLSRDERITNSFARTSERTGIPTDAAAWDARHADGVAPRVSWNAAAAFFTIPWLGYRRMAKRALVVAVMGAVLSVVIVQLVAMTLEFWMFAVAVLGWILFFGAQGESNHPAEGMAEGGRRRPQVARHRPRWTKSRPPEE